MRLLTRPDVLQWLRGDTSFLGNFPQTTKTARTAAQKAAEDAWGRALMREVRPDLQSKQWTNLFGEMICRELQERKGAQVTKPRNIEGQEPDWETETLILEAKIGTQFTEGTAHEKVLGAHVKYSEVPERQGKPLHIVCMGRAEQEVFQKQKIGAQDCPPNRRKLMDSCRAAGITQVAATSLLE